MKTTRAPAPGGTAMAIVAAATLAVTAPAVAAEPAPAETLPPADQAGVLTPTYLDCGTYYVFVSACMGDKQKSYVEIGTALWTRGRAIGKAGGITHEAMKDRVFSTRVAWAKETGSDCSKMESLHKQYKGFCEGIYQGLQSSGK